MRSKTKWWKVVRKKPYTFDGVRRLKCIRCGRRAIHQWSICSDGNNFRPICRDCDVELNELILEFVRHPKRGKLIEEYKLVN